MTQKSINEYISDSSGDNQSSNFVPETCIGFDVASDYAHFLKVGSNSAKPSYLIPPRTTVAGMIAGIMGMERDSYYDLFSPETSAVSVVPKEMPHTYTMGIKTVNTDASKAIQYLPEDQHWTKSSKMLTPKSYVKHDRQRDTYEMLVNPVYRIYVALRDESVQSDLQNRLENSHYHYSPSLGLSECIAEINNVDIHAVGSTDSDTVNSAAYDDSVVIPRPGCIIKRERAPLYMESIDGGRRTTEFGNITYASDEGSLPVNKSKSYSVGDHDVVFY